MRLTTDFFVSALVRKVFSAGGFAAIIRRGATEAGAIFIIARHQRTGQPTLFGPAPQTSYDEGRPTDRQFQPLVSLSDQSAIDARLERETKFDPDLWVVEIEPASDLETLVSIMTP